MNTTNNIFIKTFITTTSLLFLLGLVMFVPFSLSAQSVKTLRAYLSSKNIFYFNKKVLKKTAWLEMASRYNLHPNQLADFNVVQYYEDAIIPAKEIGVPLFYSVNLLEDELNIEGVVFLSAHYVVEKSVRYSSFSTKLNPDVYKVIKKLNNLEDSDVLKKGQPLFLGYFRINVQYGNSSFGKPNPIRRIKPKSYAVSQKIVGSQTPQPTKPQVRSNFKENSSLSPEVVESFFQKDFQTNNPNMGNKKCGFVSYEILLPENDGKYYILFDDCPIGNVMKIANLRTGKIIYAKVANTLPKSFKKSNQKCLLISNLVQQKLRANDEDVLDLSFASSQ